MYIDRELFKWFYGENIEGKVLILPGGMGIAYGISGYRGMIVTSKVKLK